MVIDLDDFGSNHVISDMCRSHDCRKQLDALHYANPNFKVTLFAIPGEMTWELLNWCRANESWIELGVHGIFHSSNYECEKMSYDKFDRNMTNFLVMYGNHFARLFKAPGWQISDDIYRWLDEHDWMIADQGYNDSRRPVGLAAYINNNGRFTANGNEVEAWHGHTWNCVGNGIEETFDHVKALVQNAQDFQFVSEVIK